MTLVYYDSFSKNGETRNFGDDLNPWLLSQIFGSRLIQSKEICIIGVGTLLNERLNNRVDSYERKIVFTSGVGYGRDLPAIDNSWDISCVRGPVSASSHIAFSGKGITDGALFIALFYESSTNKTNAPVYIPHIHTHRSSGSALKKACAYHGVDYLSPSVEHENFVHAVNNSRFAICEAMHGAILADTLRTPWVAVRTKNTHEFKWRDWCASMEVEYSPLNIPMIWNEPELKQKHLSFRRRIKFGFFNTQINKVLNGQLRGQVSSDDVLKKRLAQLENARDELENSYA